MSKPKSSSGAWLEFIIYVIVPFVVWLFATLCLGD